MSRQKKYIDLALEEAKKSLMSKQHGAVIVSKGRVVSTGHNRYQGRSLGGKSRRDILQTQLYKEWTLRNIDVPFNIFSNSMWGKSGCSIHAEIDAITKAGNACFGGTLYVVRRRSTDGKALESTPCKRCEKAAQRRKLKLVYT